MIFDSIEVVGAIIVFFSTKRRLLSYWHLTVPSLGWALLFGLIYAIGIFLLTQVPLTNRIFDQFVEMSLVVGNPLFLLFSGLALVCAEEILFRAFPLTIISPVYASLAFALIHWRPGDFPLLMYPILFLFGLSQSFLFSRTRSVPSVVLAHIGALSMLVWLYG